MNAQKRTKTHKRHRLLSVNMASYKGQKLYLESTIDDLDFTKYITYKRMPTLFEICSLKLHLYKPSQISSLHPPLLKERVEDVITARDEIIDDTPLYIRKIGIRNPSLFSLNWAALLDESDSFKSADKA